MAINLTKGQRVDIGLQKIGVGLGWDPSVSGGDENDLDLSAFMLAGGDQIPGEKYFVFYNNLQSPEVAVTHSGDDRTGGNSDGDDETIAVNLGIIDPRIEQIIFTATIHDVGQGGSFGQVRNAFIRIYDATNGSEICKYELDEDFSTETAVEFGRLYKRGGAWRFEAMGVGHKGGLAAFVQKYARRFA